MNHKSKKFKNSEYFTLKLCDITINYAFNELFKT